MVMPIQNQAQLKAKAEAGLAGYAPIGATQSTLASDSMQGFNSNPSLKNAAPVSTAKAGAYDTLKFQEPIQTQGAQYLAPPQQTTGATGTGNTTSSPNVMTKPVDVKGSNFTAMGASMGGTTFGIPGALIGGGAGFLADQYLAGEERERQKKLMAKQFAYMERQDRKNKQHQMQMQALQRKENARQFDATMSFNREAREDNKADKYMAALNNLYKAKRARNDSMVQKGYF